VNVTVQNLGFVVTILYDVKLRFVATFLCDVVGWGLLRGFAHSLPAHRAEEGGILFALDASSFNICHNYFVFYLYSELNG
jgi:hypothetical protein